jgi:UDP-N-acetylglucosamine:LPS N-acetylglucosamine transferase
MARILAIASGGGHWIELRRILPAFEGLDVAYASRHAESASDVPGYEYYTFCDFSRFSRQNFLPLFFQIIKILVTVRPKVVITTGSAPALLAMALAKIFLRSKTVWIDSIANVDRLSSSGSVARYFADIWLTQWKHLARAGGPQYWGAVIDMVLWRAGASALPAPEKESFASQ